MMKRGHTGLIQKHDLANCCRLHRIPPHVYNEFITLNASVWRQGLQEASTLNELRKAEP